MMVSDEKVYEDMCGDVSQEDIDRVKKMLDAWADVAEKLPDDVATLRITFLACVNTIGAMGPAYCEIAAVNLLNKAREQ